MTEKLSDKKIEEALERAVNAGTPDMLDQLMTKLELSEKTAPQLRDALLAEETDKNEVGELNSETTAINEQVEGANTNAPENPAIQFSQGFAKVYRLVILAAAIVVLVIGCFALIPGLGKKEPVAVVGLDVNPSIELSIDANEKVMAATALNEEGTGILADMDLKGTKINVACNAIIGSMLTHGYLTETSNSVLLSVRASDSARGKEIEKSVMESMSLYLDDSIIHAAILGQFVEDDDALEDYAEEHGISLGKAWLIRALLASGNGKLTEESLLKLSTQELILLGQEKKVSNEGVYGKTDTSQYIGMKEAKAIALKKAGITKKQAAGLKAEFDCEDGRIVYEVEFDYGGSEYEYDIDALTGEILFENIEAADEAEQPDDDDDANDRDDIDDDKDDDLDDEDDIDDADDRSDDEDDDDPDDDRDDDDDQDDDHDSDDDDD